MSLKQTLEGGFRHLEMTSSWLEGGRLGALYSADVDICQLNTEMEVGAEVVERV